LNEKLTANQSNLDCLLTPQDAQAMLTTGASSVCSKNL